MTSVRGYYVVKAPCCGALYEKTAYSSINLSGWERWSDGFEDGSLYSNPDNVCHCECGRFFLSADAEEVDYVRFRSWKEQEEHPEEEPIRPQPLPYVTQRDAFELVYNLTPLPSGEIEAFLRLLVWQALNEKDRVKESENWSDTWAQSELRKILGDKYNEPKLEAWILMPDAQREKMCQENLVELIPLLESKFPSWHLLIGNAYRALGDQKKSIDCFNMVTGESPKIVQYLIGQTQLSNKKVIRIDPPEWLDPVEMPEPWVNTKPGKNPITLTSRWFWFKIFGMLNQLWALIEPQADSETVTIYWIDDNASIIKSEEFASEDLAWAELQGQGYKLFEEEQDVWEIMCPPGGPYSFMNKE